jgi:hypothetical protein
MNRKKDLDLEGAGLWDYVKNVFTSNSKYTNKAQEALKKYGGFPIVNIEIQKTPIISVIDKAINLVSMGKWDELKKKYAFDKLFHLYAIFTVSINGSRKQILVEKNQSINISESIPSKTNQTKSLMIGTNKGLTINSLLDNTLKSIGPDRFYIYDGFGDRNCQSFIRDILTSNGIYNDRIGAFVFQSMESLSKELGYTTSVSKLITDTAAFGERLLGLGKDDGYTLHAVVVRKPATTEQLNDIRKKYMSDNKRFTRETQTSYRLRNIAKTRFKTDTFRTQKLNAHVSLVFGQLR